LVDAIARCRFVNTKAGGVAKKETTLNRKAICVPAVAVLCSVLVASLPAVAATSKSAVKAPVKSSVPTVKKASRLPYAGAISVDAETGQVLFEDRADVPVYPASTIKLMDLLLVLERVKQGNLRLDDKVTVSAEASRMGGSQVYLKENEVFTVEDLLHALIVQSANDAATALAIHVAGTTAAFVELMNQKAAQLGMVSTRFVSVHGLPPVSDGKPDITTARDMALLSREVLKFPEALKYTSCREYTFRKDPLFVARTHNHLLEDVNGCDGLKTGYFRLAGYSICATAQRDGKRVVVVVAGVGGEPADPTRDRNARDQKAKELIEAGFAKLRTASPPPVVKPVAPVPPPPPVSSITPAPEEADDMADADPGKPAHLWRWGIGVAVLAIVGWLMWRRTHAIQDF
jgi:D-alanyl-D-alanine carboxypeptidase (penicillin-binding protein 5/6)